MINVMITGNKELISKMNKLVQKLDREPNSTIQRVADVGQLFAVMQAPKRTGALAAGIKRSGGKNWARLSLGSGLGYPTWIDQDIVFPTWGTKMARGMTDMRPREQKVNFFVGTESKPGHTLTYLRQNFPGYVEELARRLEVR